MEQSKIIYMLETYQTRTHVEEEIYILGPTLLERPRGPLCNQRDACDEESLREPARLLGRVWEDKRYTGGTGGPAMYARKRRHASKAVSGSCQLRSYQRREGNLLSMPAQYEGPVWLLVEYKWNNKYGREKVPEPKVS